MAPVVQSNMDSGGAAGIFTCDGGPHVVLEYNGPSAEHFISSTVYHPEGAHRPLSGVVLVGGWLCGEHALKNWALFLASHGLVAMTIATPSPRSDMPSQRSVALLAAAHALKAEGDSSASPLHGRLDATRIALIGYSLGGGGVQLAAAAEASSEANLRCIVALAPHSGVNPDKDPAGHAAAVKACARHAVPALLVTCDADKRSPPAQHGRPMYDAMPAQTPRMYFEVGHGADHAAVNGPAGNGTMNSFIQSVDMCRLWCCCGLFCCAPSAFQVCWALNRPIASHKDAVAAGAAGGRGAVGGVVLAWLRIFLLDDESARASLVSPDARPGCAVAFETRLT